MSIKRPRWTVASARQNLPTLIGLAAHEPQDVYRRDQLVARVVSPDAPSASKPSVADALAELQTICAEERYTLRTSKRRDRPNPFGPATRKRSASTQPNRNARR